MTAKLSGGCLCGQVTYETSEGAVLAAHCACVDCRKSSGTSFGTHVVVKANALTVHGAVTSYEKAADSGNVVTRYFCGTCGSPIVSRNSAMPPLAMLRASSLDDLEMISPAMFVYASRKPSWAHMPEGIMTFPDMPPEMPKEMLG